MHNHRSCGNQEKVWLPFEYMGREQGLKAHLFCTKCGLVKNGSSDKPRRLGYYINLVAELGKEVKVTRVQMRLISLDLQKRGVDDVYTMDKCMQEKIFLETVKQYLNISDSVISSYLD
ncbi:MAG: hypothetical protein HPY61_14885 [Methanotrichaceae archaeon]|nr:hypothetical protein [Methanotrichaceae archaeon]